MTNENNPEEQPKQMSSEDVLRMFGGVENMPEMTEADLASIAEALNNLIKYNQEQTNDE